MEAIWLPACIALKIKCYNSLSQRSDSSSNVWVTARITGKLGIHPHQTQECCINMYTGYSYESKIIITIQSTLCMVSLMLVPILCPRGIVYIAWHAMTRCLFPRMVVLSSIVLFMHSWASSSLNVYGHVWQLSGQLHALSAVPVPVSVKVLAFIWAHKTFVAAPALDNGSVASHACK